MPTQHNISYKTMSLGILLLCLQTAVISKTHMSSVSNPCISRWTRTDLWSNHGWRSITPFRTRTFRQEVQGPTKWKEKKEPFLAFTKFIICRNLIGSFLVIGFGAQSLLYYLPLNVSIFLKSASALFGVMSLRPLFSKKLKQLRSRTHSINRFWDLVKNHLCKRKTHKSWISFDIMDIESWISWISGLEVLNF